MTVPCKATRLPCCFGCPEQVCHLVDVLGAIDTSDEPPVRRSWLRDLWRAIGRDTRAFGGKS